MSTNIRFKMRGLRRSLGSIGRDWKGSRSLVVVRQTPHEDTQQRFAPKPVDFSVITSMRSLEKYMKFNTLSWETDLKPAFWLPEEVSQKMIASAKEARQCDVIPVTFAVSVLRACEASVNMEEWMDVTSQRPDENLIENPHSPLVQLDILHDTETEGSLETFPHTTNSVISKHPLSDLPNNPAETPVRASNPSPDEKTVQNPHSPLVQLDILHDTETEGSLETFPHTSDSIISAHPLSATATRFRFDKLVQSVYIPKGQFHLSLNFPVRGCGFR